MIASIQFLSAIMMALTVGSFFWVYKVTSSSVSRPRGEDRRVSFRSEGYDRRNQAQNTVWDTAEYWAHEIVWLFVAAASLIIIVLTFDPGIGLT